MILSANLVEQLVDCLLNFWIIRSDGIVLRDFSFLINDNKSRNPVEVYIMIKIILPAVLEPVILLVIKLVFLQAFFPLLLIPVQREIDYSNIWIRSTGLFPYVFQEFSLPFLYCPSGLKAAAEEPLEKILSLKSWAPPEKKPNYKYPKPPL